MKANAESNSVKNPVVEKQIQCGKRERIGEKIGFFFLI